MQGENPPMTDRLDRTLQLLLQRAYALLGHRPALSALLTILTLVTLLPPLVLGLWALNRSVVDRRNDDIRQLAELSSTIANSVDREIRGWSETLQVVATSPMLRSGDLSGFHAWATSVVKSAGGNFAVVDRHLDQVANTRVAFGVPLPKPASRS